MTAKGFNMTKKINILYDANLLLNGLSKNSGRTGVFFVVYNVLAGLLKCDHINVELYCNVENYHSVVEYISKDKNFSGAKVLALFTWIDPILADWEYKKHLNETNKGSRIELRYIKTIIKFLSRLNSIVKLNKKPIIDKICKFDAFLSPFQGPPKIIDCCKKIKKFSIIYDIIPSIFPDLYPGARKKKFWYNKIINAINKETYYFAISECTKKDFIKYVPNIDADKILVAYLAASGEFYKCEDENLISEVRKKYNIPEGSKYIFSLCSIEPRKNLIFAVKNFIEFIKKNNIEDMYFVLGGAQWDFFIKQLDDVVEDLDKYKSKIIRAGYVDDDDLSPLYSGAFCFIYPSIYEGFGLPPLEAMQCGCPVITSNAASLPEVVGDAAIMINPASDEELIDALENVYYNKNLKNELSLKGLSRAKEFSWDKTVTTITDKITAICNEQSNNHSLKKVLIVYPSFYIYGGGETLIVKLCNYLTDAGVENAILTTFMLPEISGDLINTKVHIYKSKSNSTRQVFKSLCKGIRELSNSYDLINPHNFPADIAAMLSLKPKVWMCNEPETYLVLNDPRFKGDSQYSFFKFSFLVEKFFAKFLLKNAVVADEFNAQRFKTLFGYKPKIINYGVDYDFFSKEPEDNPLKELYKNKFVVLQSGMMQPLKNQMASLETINKIKDKIPNILLILTGSTVDIDYQNKLLEYIKQHNLGNYVHIKGHVSREEVRKFYYASDVLLHPIKPQGGWLTPFEFLSTGRPIIVSEEFPPKDILNDNQIGTVTSDYVKAILDVYNNPDTYKQMAQKGKKIVSENLLWNNYCKKMLEYFIEVCKC